jgi:hypothetical protein
MKLFGSVIVLCVGAIASTALAQPTSQEVKVPGGVIKVSITPLAATSAPKGSKTAPHVGVSLTGVMPTPIARKLDDIGSVQVVSPAKFSVGAAGGSFDTVTRSEFADALSAGCRQSRADYALYSGQPEITGGMSTTAYIFGFGRIKNAKTFEMRLYDCRTREIDWDAKVEIEASAGIWTNAFAGKISGGGAESEDAAAQIIAVKLLTDMGWSPGPSTAGTSTAASATPTVPIPAASPAQNTGAVTMSKPGHMYSIASPKGRVLKTVAAGALLYPTGAVQGVWQEVTDEEGTKGWISSRLISPYP